MNTGSNHIEAEWTRLGVLFNVEPVSATPDPERLLLRTTISLANNARLLDLVATWLVRNGSLVARHRLRRLVITELPARVQPHLGLLLDSAVAIGAEPELAIVRAVCRPAPLTDHGPLADVQRGHAGLRELAFKHASDVSKQWGLWAPPVRLRLEAIRSPGWIMDTNPELRERAMRQGDLRCSIIESLRRDGPGWARSEMALARLAGASRSAVRKAVAALVTEGDLTVERLPGNQRDRRVALRSAA